MNICALVASLAVFLFTYALIGAVAMILVGTVFGFYNPHTVTEVIDVDTFWLLSGMMSVVGLLQRTGFFQYVEIKTAKWARGMALLFLVPSLLLSAVPTTVAFVPLVNELGSLGASFYGSGCARAGSCEVRGWTTFRRFSPTSSL